MVSLYHFDLLILGCNNPPAFQQHDKNAVGHGHISSVALPWTYQQISDGTWAIYFNLVPPVCQNAAALTMIGNLFGAFVCISWALSDWYQTRLDHADTASDSPDQSHWPRKLTEDWSPSWNRKGYGLFLMRPARLLVSRSRSRTFEMAPLTLQQFLISPSEEPLDPKTGQYFQ